MLIKIAERLRPYSHVAGTKVIVPGTNIAVTVFPALIRFEDRELPLAIKGPVEGFTVQLDLEKGAIKVWGKAVNGYFRYRIQASSSGQVLLIPEKIPDMKMPTDTLYKPPEIERLSLGCSKAQDWTRVSERLDISEFFPAWLRMGLLVPASLSSGTGTTELLQQCAKCVDRTQVSANFKTLFRSAFDGILAPRLSDKGHQGLALSSPVSTESALALLSEGAQIIKGLFFQHEGHDIRLLPQLAPELHCGRFISLSCGPSSLDMEWSKHILRRVVFRCRESGTWTFHLGKEPKEYRLRFTGEKNGRTVICGTSLELLSGRDYFFDNFRK